MSIALIVMLLIVAVAVVRTINRFAAKDRIHKSVEQGLELAIVVGAVLWWLVFFRAITVS